MGKFQIFWQEKYDLKEVTETMAASLGFFGSTNSIYQPTSEEEATYGESVDNFGTSFAANFTAFL